MRTQEARIANLQEQINSKRSYLAEGPWKPYVQKIQRQSGIATRRDRCNLAQILENEAIHIAGLNEETRTANIGSFEKFIFPMIRAVWPNLISTELVSMQPIEGPYSMLFFLDFTAGTAKGNISKDQALITARKGMQEEGSDYYSETVNSESIADSVGVAAGNLQFVPIRPNSVYVSWLGAAASPARDDGSGNLSAAGGVTGTIDYNTGAISITPTGGFTTGTVTVTYDYVSELSDLVPQLDISLTSAPVTSRAYKIRSRWSAEVAAQLKSLYGLDAEYELMEALAQQVRFGIDNKVINDVFRVASAGAVTFDVNPPTATVPYFTHQMSLLKTMMSGSNKIFKQTRRGFGNWIVAGVDASTIIESHPLFESAGNLNGPGIVFAGTLANRWKVFKNPFLNNVNGSPFGPTNFLIGFKGNNFFDAGYIYAPWIPFFTTPTVMLDDMMFRKGVMTHFATKVVNGNFYCSGTILNA